MSECGISKEYKINIYIRILCKINWIYNKYGTWYSVLINVYLSNVSAKQKTEIKITLSTSTLWYYDFYNSKSLEVHFINTMLLLKKIIINLYTIPYNFNTTIASCQ